MKLNEKFYTRTVYGLAECDGKRISENYAIIKPWFTKDTVYYLIHIPSGLKVGTDHSTIKDCMGNFVKDLVATKNRLKEKGLDFDKQIEKGIERYNELMEEKVFYKKYYTEEEFKEMERRREEWIKKVIK